ncbi:MAG: GtrA family protein [Bryobacteraceae bacterium]
MKFYTVGGLGIVVQLAVLALLKTGAGMHYLMATAVAVEAAVLHNFLWHERWTWSDRTSGVTGVASRCVRFHISNGILSLAGNLVLMRLLVGSMGFPYLPSNLASILVCALLNFLASEYLVFRQSRAGG